MPRPFLIVFSGSTGSSWLIAQLRRRGDIDARGEALADIETAAEQRRFIESFYGGPGPGARGFKVKVAQMADPEDVRLAVAAFAPRMIHLVRNNRAKQAVSLITSSALSRRSRDLIGRPAANLSRADLDSHPELRLSPMEVDIGQLLHVIRRIEEREARIAEFLTDFDAAVFAYEELLADPQAFIDRFCDEIDVERHHLAEDDLVKKTSDDLRAAVTNFDQCLEALAGTPYAGQLLEGASGEVRR